MCEIIRDTGWKRWHEVHCVREKIYDSLPICRFTLGRQQKVAAIYYIIFQNQFRSKFFPVSSLLSRWNQQSRREVTSIKITAGSIPRNYIHSNYSVKENGIRNGDRSSPLTRCKSIFATLLHYRSIIDDVIKNNSNLFLCLSHEKKNLPVSDVIQWLQWKARSHRCDKMWTICLPNHFQSLLIKQFRVFVISYVSFSYRNSVKSNDKKKFSLEKMVENEQSFSTIRLESAKLTLFMEIYASMIVNRFLYLIIIWYTRRTQTVFIFSHYLEYF